MRPPHWVQAPTKALLSLLLAAIPTGASPYPRDKLRDVGFGYLMDRDCANYCGVDNQFCCSAEQACVTSKDIASCAPVETAGGGYAFVTSTWTETRTYTTTYSTYHPGATTPASGETGGGVACVPPAGSGQIACGPICCTDWQYCSDPVKGQCLPNAAASEWWLTATTVGTTVVVTTAFSAPYRATAATTVYSTATSTAATATSTGTNEPLPVTSTTSQLSGGAIAGIVIGSILGVILLLTVCACCIVGERLAHKLLAILGLGKKKKPASERVEIEEVWSRRHRGSGSASAAVRPVHRNWYGGITDRPAAGGARRAKEKPGDGGGRLAKLGAAAAMLFGARPSEKYTKPRQQSERVLVAEPVRAAPHRSHRTQSSYTRSSYLTGSRSPQTGSPRESFSGAPARSRSTRRSRQRRASRAGSRHTRRS